MQREQLRHGAAAEREADDVRAVDLQEIEQARHVERLLAAVLPGIVRRAALALPARVIGDDAEILGESVDHAGRDPAFQAGRAAVQQHDRLALAAVDVVDLDTVEFGELAVLDGSGPRYVRETEHQRGDCPRELLMA